MKTKMRSLLRLAFPYILIAVVPIASVAFLFTHILNSNTKAAVADLDSSMEIAMERVDQKITSVVELSYLIAESDMMHQYVLNGLAGKENGMQDCEDIKDLLSGVAQNEQIAEIYFFDCYTNRIIASDTVLNDSWLFFEYEYCPSGLTPEEALARLQASTWGYGYGYSDAKMVTIDNKPTEVIEYRISVPVERYGRSQSQLIISLDAEKLFEDVIDRMTEGAEFYIYNGQRLIYSSGDTYADMAQTELPERLEKVKTSAGRVYASELSCNDGVWHMQVFYPQADTSTRHMQSNWYLLLIAILPVLFCIAVGVYFTHKNHKQIVELLSLFRGEDVPEEDLKDRYVDYDLVRSYAGYVVEKNSSYRTRLREIDDSRKDRLLENLVRGACPVKEQEEIARSLEPGVLQCPCAAVCIQSEDIANEKYTINDKTVRDMILEYLRNEVGTSMQIIPDRHGQILCILPADDGFEATVDQIISDLTVHYCYRYGIDLKFGTGGKVESVFQIHQSCEQAKEVIRYNESTGSSVRFYRQLDGKTELAFYPIQTDEKVANYMVAGHAREAKEVIEQIYIENFRSNDRILSPETVDMIKYRATNAVMSVAEKQGVAIDNADKQFLKEKNLQKYFKALMELIDLSVNEISGRKTSAQNTLACKVRDYVQEHYMERGLSIKQIAGVFHFHENYISNIYKEECGENLSSAIERIRIEEACRLLQTTDVKVNQIAETIGYASDSSFRRAFKKIMGVSPVDYRNSHE